MRNKSIVGGGLFFLLGLGIALYSRLTLPTGDIVNIGPGLFPSALGVIMAMLGISIFVRGMKEGRERITVSVRPAFFLLASILVFGAVLRAAGMVPAIVAMTVVASLAHRGMGPKKVLALAAALVFVAYVIFVAGLDMSIPLFAWEW